MAKKDKDQIEIPRKKSFHWKARTRKTLVDGTAKTKKIFLFAIKGLF